MDDFQILMRLSLFIHFMDVCGYIEDERNIERVFMRIMVEVEGEYTGQTHERNKGDVC